VSRLIQEQAHRTAVQTYSKLHRESERSIPLPSGRLPRHRERIFSTSGIEIGLVFAEAGFLFVLQNLKEDVGAGIELSPEIPKPLGKPRMRPTLPSLEIVALRVA
jgi:hypothetical protein